MLNSTFLGSMSTIFSSAGCFLYRSDVMIALRPTDFPCPVAPATSRCGILARSNMNTSLVMVFPTAQGSSIVVSWNFFELSMLSIDTMFCFALGTSMPMVPFPGIGAMILMPNAERLSAMSSSRLRIFEILTPCAGVISYRVIVGPTVAFMLLISTPKLRNTSTMRFLLAVCSAMSM